MGLDETEIIGRGFGSDIFKALPSIFIDGRNFFFETIWLATQKFILLKPISKDNNYSLQSVTTRIHILHPMFFFVSILTYHSSSTVEYVFFYTPQLKIINQLIQIIIEWLFSHNNETRVQFLYEDYHLSLPVQRFITFSCIFFFILEPATYNVMYQGEISPANRMITHFFKFAYQSCVTYQFVDIFCNHNLNLSIRKTQDWDETFPSE